MASRAPAGCGRFEPSPGHAPGIEVGRRRAGALASSVELILKDDRCGLTIHLLTIPVSLRSRRRAARAAPRHRPEAGLSDVAREALVAQRHRESQRLPDGP